MKTHQRITTKEEIYIMRDYEKREAAFSAWKMAKKPFDERLAAARSACEKARLEGESAEEISKKKEAKAQKEKVLNELRGKLEEVEDKIRKSEYFPCDELVSEYVALNNKINVAEIWVSSLKPISRLDFANIEYDEAFEAWYKFDKENPMPD